MFVSASLGTKPWAQCIFFFFFFFFFCQKRLCATQFLLFYFIFIAFLGFFFFFCQFFSFFLWIIKIIFKKLMNIQKKHQILFELIKHVVSSTTFLIFKKNQWERISSFCSDKHWPFFSVCGCQLHNVMDQIFQTFWKPKSMVGVQKSIAIFGISIDSFECIQAILCLV